MIQAPAAPAAGAFQQIDNFAVFVYIDSIK
jgi:hypothetical protein